MQNSQQKYILRICVRTICAACTAEVLRTLTQRFGSSIRRIIVVIYIISRPKEIVHTFTLTSMRLRCQKKRSTHAGHADRSYTLRSTRSHAACGRRSRWGDRRCIADTRFGIGVAHGRQLSLLPADILQLRSVASGHLNVGIWGRSSFARVVDQ